MRTYTFLMPGEERIFFTFFHVIVFLLLVFFWAMGVILADLSFPESLLRAAVLVSPMYLVYFLFAKRFADQVSLDFEARRVRFLFSDERGVVEKNFDDIVEIKFRYYLVFVLADAKVMIKRPPDKKEIFEMLSPVFKVDRGVFAAS